MRPSSDADRAPAAPRPDRTLKWAVITFAVVEAALLAWALLSGRIG